MRHIVLFAAVLAATACSRPAADNLLFVSFDTTRADHLSPYGYAHETSPAIGYLARRGVLFESAFTHAPSTLAAHVSMFTGLLPPSHGVRCNGKYRLDPSVPTLAEMVAERGFETGAVVGAFPLESRFGLAQGFDYYDDDFGASALATKRRKGRKDTAGFWIGHDFVDFERGADQVTNLALRWLEAREDRWFLFVHYFDPHWRHEPAESWGARFELPYDAEIAYADHHLGRLLEAVAEMPGRTLVVFTSDHGEGLGDHAEATHGGFLYNSTLRVPLIIALDGVFAGGRRVPRNVSQVDLLPTVLELLAVPTPAGLPGRSLVPDLRGEETRDSRLVYGETLVPTLERPLGISRRVLIDGDYKLIESEHVGRESRVELYNFAADPGEFSSLASAEPGQVERMRTRLKAWRDELEADAPVPNAIEMDEDALARLKVLGYL